MNFPAFQKRYGERLVLDMPPFSLEPGRVCGVLGANGSGKSTLAKILAGVLPPDSGRPVTPLGTVVGYMPQKSYPFRMSVRRNLLVAKKDARRAGRLLEALGISHLAEQKAGLLSGGELARMALARTLMRSCQLMILDEPTAAMDMESTAAAEALIRDYCKETGAAVLLVTHSLQQARRTADDALFLWQGQLTEQGPAARVLFQPEHPRTKEFLEFYA